MRTTITLDNDVVRLLKDAAHSRGTSFKVALNDSVREAFRKTPAAHKRRKPFVVKPHPMGLRPGIDPTRLNELAGDLEIEAFLAHSSKPRKQKS